MQMTLQKLLDSKIVAIIRGIETDKMLNLVQALKQGGISCIEVTFDQSSSFGVENTINSIKTLQASFGTEITLGAGTVLTAPQVQMAKDAGASFILSPNTDVAVIQKAKQLGMVAIPGAFTASEAVLAWQSGADIVKLFPMSHVGPSYIQALKGPLSHIRFSAVGGVNEKNAAEFLKAGACSIGVGGNLVNKKLIDAGEFTEIERLAKEYVQAINM